MMLAKFTTLASTPYQLNLPPLEGGAVATFTVQHATPLQVQFVAFSLAGTATLPIPALGTTLGLAVPQLLMIGVADGFGAWSVDLTIPAGAVGVTAWFQGLQLNGATPVVKRTVQ
jgi:hypothetical protein